MRFLVDNSVSPRVSNALGEAGHDSKHVVEFGMRNAEDAAILKRAEADGRIVVTADTDFGTLVVLSGASKPSVITFRTGVRSPFRQIATLRANLSTLEDDLETGAIVTIEEGRARVHRLMGD